MGDAHGVENIRFSGFSQGTYETCVSHRRLTRNKCHVLFCIHSAEPKNPKSFIFGPFCSRPSHFPLSLQQIINSQLE